MTSNERYHTELIEIYCATPGECPEIPRSTSEVWQEATDTADRLCEAARRQNVSLQDLTNQLRCIIPPHTEIDDWSDAKLALTQALAVRWEKHQGVSNG